MKKENIENLKKAIIAGIEAFEFLEENYTRYAPQISLHDFYHSKIYSKRKISNKLSVEDQHNLKSIADVIGVMKGALMISGITNKEIKKLKNL